MQRVVQYLVFKPDSRAGGLLFRRQPDKVFYSAVSSGRQQEFEGEVKCLIGILCDDISANTSFFAGSFMDADGATADRPACIREFILVGAHPITGCFTV